MRLAFLYFSTIPTIDFLLISFKIIIKRVPILPLALVHISGKYFKSIALNLLYQERTLFQRTIRLLYFWT